MSQMPEPWIAFKILAAGALHPKNEFKHAFERGADFICVGMYDFQIVDDVNLALAVLGAPAVAQHGTHSFTITPASASTETRS